MIRPLKKWMFLYALLISSTMGGHATLAMGSDEYIPNEFQDWSQSGQDRVITSQNLFEYIDGGAELYLSFGFKKLIVRTFKKQDFPVLEVDFFDMGRADNAFGIFRHDCEEEGAQVGQGSELGPGWLRFWQDHYFIYIFSETEFPGIKEILINLGKDIALRIGKTSPEPALVKYLPSQDLLRSSLRYFHSHQNLNYYYYLSNKNILNLSATTNAVLAKYVRMTETGLVVLIAYVTPEAATEARNNCMRAYLQDISMTVGKAVQTENGRWASCQSHSRFLWLILDASSEAYNTHLSKQIEHLIQGVVYD